MENFTLDNSIEKVQPVHSKEDNDQNIKEAIIMMNSLKDFCKKHRIPMFSVIADVNDKDEAKYMPRVVTPFVVKKNIRNDKISKFNAAINGDFYLKVTEPKDDQMVEIFDELSVTD